MSPRRAAVLVLGTVGLVTAAWRAGLFQPEEDPLRSSLLDALGRVRPTEARFVGLPFAPYPSPFSLANPAEDVGEAIDAITRAAADDPVARANDALVKLLQGHLDPAVETFERLAREHGGARPLADLAAAYLLRYEQKTDPFDLVRTLDAAAGALRLDSSLQEARHNRALALERLFLTHQARAGWEHYRQQEKDAGWAGEAAGRPVPARVTLRLEEHEIEALRGAVSRGDLAWVGAHAARAPERFRRYVEETLWGEWADAVAAGRPAEAQGALAVARAVGDALLRATGDPMVRDTAAALEQAAAGADRRRLDLLVRGHRAYAEGLRSGGGNQDAEALERFQEAARLLAAGGSPFQGWAEVKAAMFHFYRHDLQEALERLDRLERKLGKDRYPVLRGFACRVAGWMHFRAGSFSAALQRYTEALPLFEGALEVEQAAGVHFNFAETLRLQGELERAWTYRYEALRRTRGFEGSVSRHNALFDAAEAAFEQGLPQAALLFHGEMVRSALNAKVRDPLRIAETLVRRGRVHARLGDEETSLKDLDRAALWTAMAPQGVRRSQLEADISAALGEGRLEEDPGRAVREVGRAISFYRTRTVRFNLPRLFYLRARAFLLLGDVASAEEDLGAGIAESERQREQVLDEQLRISYADQMQVLYDEMVRLQIRRNELRQAFDYAERARTRNLRETFGAGEPAKISARALTSEEVQDRLPEDTALVAYSLLEDRSRAWVLTRERFALVELRSTGPAFEDKVARLRKAFQTGGSRAETQRLLRELFDLLVQPLLGHLGGSGTLIVVPDKSLHFVPFQALRDKSTGRYVIEDRAVAYAPSATLFALASARSLELARDPDPGALILGDPELDGKIFGTLLDLPGAAAEARQAAAIHGDDADLRLGARATVDVFLEEAPRHGIVHIASHALVNPEYPLLSAIALAPGDDPEAEPGPLYAHQIYPLRFDRTRLVVLAGCDTGSGSVSASEGLSSLARPFLAAGVPAVVASLWRVDDDAAPELFQKFHTSLRRGEDPLTALRKAQIALLQSADPELHDPAAWAPFQLMGGFVPSTER
jgi:CHAT domain-containing protein